MLPVQSQPEMQLMGRMTPVGVDLQKKKEGGLPTCQTSAADWGILFLPPARTLYSVISRQTESKWLQKRWTVGTP